MVAYVKIMMVKSQEDYTFGVSLLTLAFLARNLRLSWLFAELKAFRVIVEMLMKMSMPFLTMAACLYLIFYIFAIVGNYGLGGQIRVPAFHSEAGIPNNLYFMVNFNDLGSSMVTLYAFMIINNWPAITDMMVGVAGSGWPRVFFMLFYILVQWIILNIVIAMMLEVFTNVDEEIDAEYEKLANVKRLRAIADRTDLATFRAACDRVNQDLLREECEESIVEERAAESKRRAISVSALFYKHQSTHNLIDLLRRTSRPSRRI